MQRNIYLELFTTNVKILINFINNPEQHETRRILFINLLIVQFIIKL